MLSKKKQAKNKRLLNVDFSGPSDIKIQSSKQVMSAPNGSKAGNNESSHPVVSLGLSTV